MKTAALILGYVATTNMFWLAATGHTILPVLAMMAVAIAMFGLVIVEE